MKSEEISGLTLWFTKRDLEKQVSVLLRASLKYNFWDACIRPTDKQLFIYTVRFLLFHTPCVVCML